jgi:hypothetical protein
MLRHPPGRGYYDWPPPPLREVRARWLWWLGLIAVALAVLALVAFVISHDDPRRPGLSERAWLTLVLAALLLVLLGLHHRLGALALLRALTEYAVVALLAVLLTVTALPAAPDSSHAADKSAANQPAANQPGPAAKGAGDGCPPVKRVHAWLACLWHQANAPDPKPEQGRAMPRSPAPSTRRTP